MITPRSQWYREQAADEVAMLPEWVSLPTMYSLKGMYNSARRAAHWAWAAMDEEDFAAENGIHAAREDAVDTPETLNRGDTDGIA